MKSGDILAGKFRILEKIGEGGMGTVWSGENLSTGGKVALKLIQPSNYEIRTLELRQRMMREARACGKLSHPNIVKLYDVSETREGAPFLVMELLQGQTLGDMLKEKRRIPPPLAARIGAEIATALTAAHEAKIIHRDLKPANVFLHRDRGVDGSFVVKVLDFGVCKIMESLDNPPTVPSVVVGSPAYMSPEQITLRKDLDHRTDLWSLGIVLYEMLTGVRPCTGSPAEVVRQILLTAMTPIPPPSSRVQRVPPELDAIVARCLEPNRDKRYQNASDVARALLSIAETSRSARIPVAWSSPAPPRSPALSAAAESGAVDDEELIATMPINPAILEESRRRPDVSSPAERATATEILPSTEPIASPLPAWRQEMQRVLAAHRESSTGLPHGMPEDAQNGGTLMLETGAAIDAAARPGAPVAPNTEHVHAQRDRSSPSLKAAPTNSGRSLVMQRGRGRAAVFGALVLVVVAVVIMMTYVTGHAGALRTQGRTSAAPSARALPPESKPSAPAPEPPRQALPPHSAADKMDKEAPPPSVAPSATSVLPKKPPQQSKQKACRTGMFVHPCRSGMGDPVGI